MMPILFTVSRATRNGWRYSGLACERCAATLRIFSPYGRAARIRSCALRIFDAETISIALVILRVLCTLLILVRISLLPAMRLVLNRNCCQFSNYRGANLVGAVFLPVLDGSLESLLFVAADIFSFFDTVEERAVLVLDVVAQAAFRGQRFFDVDVVEITIVDREQRQRHFVHLHRL